MKQVPKKIESELANLALDMNNRLDKAAKEGRFQAAEASADLAKAMTAATERVVCTWINAHTSLTASSVVGKGTWRDLPIGTPVIVQRDDGTLLQTITLATPRELGGQPVVDVAGISGPYHLRCVYLRRQP